MEKALKDLRDSGWRVAIHSDYRQNGLDLTFWLLTHECGVWVKGEGISDFAALTECQEQARKLFRPSP